MKQFDVVGKEVANLRRTQWLECLRLSQHIRGIHNRTADEQSRQGDDWYPSMNLIKRWYPADKEKAAARDIGRQAAKDAERAIRNQQEEERLKAFMQEHDDLIESGGRLDR